MCTLLLLIYDISIAQSYCCVIKNLIDSLYFAPYNKEKI